MSERVIFTRSTIMRQGLPNVDGIASAIGEMLLRGFRVAAFGEKVLSQPCSMDVLEYADKTLQRLEIEGLRTYQNSNARQHHGL